MFLLVFLLPEQRNNVSEIGRSSAGKISTSLQGAILLQPHVMYCRVWKSCQEAEFLLLFTEKEAIGFERLST